MERHCEGRDCAHDSIPPFLAISMIIVIMIAVIVVETFANTLA
jgi:hypothetical protein